MALPKRRLRFSLAALLFLFTAAALWLGRATYLARRHQDAAAAITASEGIIQYKKALAPAWLQKAIGEEYFQVVDSVDFATNVGRKQGSQEPKVNDAALANLAGLASVKTLELGNNESVGDEQLKYLRPLTGLRVLYLYRTAVEGPGLAELVDLPELEAINLFRTPVDDRAAVHLGKMAGLRFLGLADTNVTDAGVRELASITNLRILTLDRTAITDAAIPDLAKLKQLEELDLIDAKITAEGADRLREALPKCNIIVNFALGKSRDDQDIVQPGESLTLAELNARFKQRGIDGRVMAGAGNAAGQTASLFLSETTLSDRVLLQVVESLPNLQELIIRQSMATDEFLAGLPRTLPLTYLELSGSRITDVGLQHLAQFAALEELGLGSTEITDAGLMAFLKLGSLRKLSLPDSGVTPAGIAKFKAARPGCTVIGE
jgi:hypothetical protein